MNIRFIKQEALDNLKVNISYNIEHYTDENNKWVYDFFQGDDPFLDFKYTVKDFELDMSEDVPQRTDLNNIKVIYENLNFLTESQASDERFWTGLTHDKFWNYMKYRWGDNILNNSKTKEKKVDQIKQSYFYGYGTRRSAAWNGIAKLWWTGRLTYDSTLDNPYEITEYVANDLDTTILYLMSSRFTKNKDIRLGMFKAILEFERKGIKIARTRLNELMKYINILGGSYLLDYFSENEIKKKCINYLEKITYKKDKEHAKENELNAFTERINNNKNKLTGIQLRVMNYIIDNINEIDEYKNCNELAKRLGVSPKAINVALLKMKLGSYGRFIGFINKLKESDKKKVS